MASKKGTSSTPPPTHTHNTNLSTSQGEKVTERTPIAFHYTRNFRPGQSLIVEDDLIACDADVAPTALRAGLEDPVVTVCTLTTDLSVVPKELFFRETTSDGVEYLGLDFTLNMLVDSASLVFELRVEGVSFLGF